MSIVNLSQIAQALDAMMPELTPVPVGTIDFAHDVPEGWLECNGAAVSRTKYARLFKKIGTKYGAGDGSTTFNLPNLHHRVLEATSTISEVGQVMEAGLPDINGWLSFHGQVENGSGCSVLGEARGVFSPTNRQNISGQPTRGTGSISYGAANFKASLGNAMFGKATTNQNNALRLLAIIKH